MTTATPGRPDASEYAPYYARYIEPLGDEPIVDCLRRQLGETLAALKAAEPARWTHRYAPDKWSLKQVIGHVVDCERIFGFRALAIARGEKAPLPGFDQDEYVRQGGFDARRPESLLAEMEFVRRANLAFFDGLDEAAWLRRGEANGVEVTVRALAYIIAGHERHHLHIVRTRYLQEAAS